MVDIIPYIYNASIIMFGEHTASSVMDVILYIYNISIIMFDRYATSAMQNLVFTTEKFVRIRLLGSSTF